jgi:hypothetical protein
MESFVLVIFLAVHYFSGAFYSIDGFKDEQECASAANNIYYSIYKDSPVKRLFACVKQTSTFKQ